MKNFLNELKNLTEYNDHTEARLKIAQFYNLRKFEKIIIAIKQIRDAEGFMPNSIGLYLNQITGEMFDYIRNFQPDGSEQVKQIKACL